jgi:hypothetical protein
VGTATSRQRDIQRTDEKEKNAERDHSGTLSLRVKDLRALNALYK